MGSKGRKNVKKPKAGAKKEAPAPKKKNTPRKKKYGFISTCL